jgi:peptidoglycan/xylan/chitin deacetylase (PgdA/CDA1 family)
MLLVKPKKLSGMNHMHIKYFSWACLVILALSGFNVNGYGQGKTADKQINVVFRYDDYAWNSVTSAELKIIEAFSKNRVPITFGVIPFKVAGDVHDPSPQDLMPLDSLKAEILKSGFEEGILEISMHGYSHQTNGSEDLSEFANLVFEEQVKRLSTGKEFLQHVTGAPVRTFIPPWNTYDTNTLSAMEETGFSTLSANKKGLVLSGSNINYLPTSCGLTELKDAVRAARKSSDNQPLVVVLLHDYDFLDINPQTGEITFQDFTNLMDWVSAQEDLRILSISQAGEWIEDLGADRAKRTKRIYYLEKIPPISLGSSMLLYQESPSFALVLLKMAAFYSIFIITGVVLFFWIRYNYSGKGTKEAVSFGNNTHKGK